MNYHRAAPAAPLASLRENFRALAFSLGVVFLLVAGGTARADGVKRSIQQPIDRTIKALSEFSRAAVTLVRAEIGTGKSGSKWVLHRQVEEGEYVAFGVGAKANVAQLELVAMGEDGAELKRAQGADEVYIASIPVEKKQLLKLELSVDTVDQKDQVGAFILCLLTKRQPPESTDFLVDMALEQVKAVEKDGYEVEYGQFDTLSKDAPWSFLRKLTGGSYRVLGVSDDAKVKDLDVQVKDSSGAVAGKDERTDHISLAKVEAKAGDYSIQTSATFNEGEKSTFAGVLVAKKP
jgi:hypothetical protein